MEFASSGCDDDTSSRYGVHLKIDNPFIFGSQSINNNDLIYGKDET